MKCINNVAQLAKAGARRLFGQLVLACLAVLVMTSGLYAQTSGSSFPDLTETVDITEVCTKVAAFLAVAVGAVLALKLGMAILSGLMSWFGVGKRRVV